MLKPSLINAGDLRHKVTIEQQTEARTAQGGIANSGWATLVTEWAAINPITARQYIEADQLKAEITHEVTIRYHSGLSAVVAHGYRIAFGSRYFDILGILTPAEIGSYQTYFCKEVSAGG